MPGPSLSAWRAFAGRYAIALVVAMVCTATAVAAVDREIDRRVASIARVDVTVATPPPQGANYLLIGSDTREGAICENPIDRDAFCDDTTDGGKNSDTMMVAHIEPGAQSAQVVSFPRDLKVEIPDSGGRTAKINSFYGSGGPQAVIDMLKWNFDIDLHHYVEVDFNTFREVVNAIGTVNVWFDHPTRDEFTGLGQPPGCQALDGDEALHYVRSRYMEQEIDGEWQYVGQDAPDLHRIERQQDFIRKLLGVATSRSLGNPLIALNLADNALQYTKLDQGVQRDQVNELIRAFRTVDVNDPHAVRFQTIPTAVDPANPQSTLVLGEGAQELIDQLRTFGLGAPPPSFVTPAQVKVRVIDVNYRSTADDRAPSVAAGLVEMGFQARAAKASKVPDLFTSIHYGPTQLAAAKLLASYVPDAGLIPDPGLTDHLVLFVGGTFAALTAPVTTMLPVATEAPPTSTEASVPGAVPATLAPTTLPVDPARAACG